MSSVIKSTSPLQSWGARWYHRHCYVPTDSWLVRRWGAVVGTTKYSEQNHNPKEKGFKLKEYSRLKGHESFSEFTSKNRPSRPSWLCGLSARSPGESPPANYNWLWATAHSGHARALPIPYFAKVFRAGGLLDMIAHLLRRLSSILHVFL